MCICIQINCHVKLHVITVALSLWIVLVFCSSFFCYCFVFVIYVFVIVINYNFFIVFVKEFILFHYWQFFVVIFVNVSHTGSACRTALRLHLDGEQLASQLLMSSAWTEAAVNVIRQEWKQQVNSMVSVDCLTGGMCWPGRFYDHC